MAEESLYNFSKTLLKAHGGSFPLFKHRNAVEDEPREKNDPNLVPTHTIPESLESTF